MHVLLEGTPADIDTVALRAEIRNISGLADVHDLHAWSLTTGVNALSVHVALSDGSDPGAVLSSVHRRVTSGFPITHAMVQVEPAGWDGDAGEVHA